MSIKLSTSFQDDVLDGAMGGKRRYSMSVDAYGTMLTDVTQYTQEGSSFGAANINATNKAVNAIIDNICDAIENSTTATSAHAVGEFIQYPDENGDAQFAEVTAAIAISDTIEDGVNVENKSIGEVLASLNSRLTQLESKGWTKLDTISVSGGTNTSNYKTSTADISGYSELMLATYVNYGTSSQNMVSSTTFPKDSDTYQINDIVSYHTGSAPTWSYRTEYHVDTKEFRETVLYYASGTASITGVLYGK